MRYLITGAAGFLGSALANRLIKEGHSVCGLDDLSAGSSSTLSPEVQFEKGDVNDRERLWTLLKNIDCVYHLAAKVLVPESVLHPSDYNRVNVGGTVTLMESIRDVGVKRVVFISSGAVYGAQTDQPMKESAIPHPRSPYAVSKLASEYYINTIGALWGIETVSLRVFNVYGPGQQMPPVHTPVIPSFLRQSCQNGTIVAHGDGLQTRDYVYIDDVVNAMISAATAVDVNQAIINIGSGQETSIRELIRLVKEVSGGKPEIVFNPKNEGGPARMCADISLARQVLNYQPQISLSVGLRMTLERDPRFTQKINGNGHA